jgi:hypothetical protein
MRWSEKVELRLRNKRLLREKAAQAVQKAHALAAEVAQRHVERRRQGAPAPERGVWFDRARNPWLEPPEDGKFVILGFLTNKQIAAFYQLREIRDFDGNAAVISDFTKQSGEFAFEANALGHEAALTVLQVAFRRGAEFRIALDGEGRSATSKRPPPQGGLVFSHAEIENQAFATRVFAALHEAHAASDKAIRQCLDKMRSKGIDVQPGAPVPIVHTSGEWFRTVADGGNHVVLITTPTRRLLAALATFGQVWRFDARGSPYILSEFMKWYGTENNEVNRRSVAAACEILNARLREEASFEAGFAPLD